MPDQLCMVRLLLDARRLAARAQLERLPQRQEDLGYPVHAQLAALFGEGSVQPFQLRPNGGRWLCVLGYTRRTEDELRAHADDFAEPQDHASCDWHQIASKAMPERWDAGRRLGFEVRACPVVRLGFPATLQGKDGQPRTYRQGSEVDAWLHHRFISGCDDPKRPEDRSGSREEVYGAWLKKRLGKAAELESSQIVAFRRSRLVRKDHSSKRRSRVLERPDVLIQGSLQPRESASFRQLLERGIGRHKAYGFGMLLLRPAE